MAKKRAKPLTKHGKEKISKDIKVQTLVFLPDDKLTYVFENPHHIGVAKQVFGSP